MLQKTLLMLVGVLVVCDYSYYSCSDWTNTVRTLRINVRHEDNQVKEVTKSLYKIKRVLFILIYACIHSPKGMERGKEH